MRTSLRLLPAIIAAALLTACGSGGGSGLPSSGPANTALAHPVTSSHSYSLLENGASVANTHVMGVVGSPLYALNSLFPPAGALPYNGGLVETSVKFVVVYWGSSDPNGLQARLNGFVGAVGGSQWLQNDNQYYQIVSGTKTHITNPSGNFVGSWVDTVNPIPTQPTDAQIQQEAQRAATHFGVSGIQYSILVQTEHGHNSAGFGTQFCAYHGNVGTLVYSNMPYMPDAGANCGANIINKGTIGKLDGETIVAGHEMAEAQTDPQPPSGWSGNSGEIGDLCAWQNIRNTKFGSTTYPTQPLYSDKKPGCVQ